jgi:hypothetical protein
MWWARLLNNIVALLGGAAAADTAFDSIATVTVGSGGASSAAFTSIPSTYKHLQIRLIARTTATGSADGGFMTVRFNDISSAASYYGQHWLRGNGTAAAAGADGTATNLYMERISTDQQTASSYGAGIIDILDYTNTNKNRVTRQLIGYDANGSGQIYFGSGMLLSTPAITKIELFPNSGSFKQHSSFALYGVK